MYLLTLTLPGLYRLCRGVCITDLALLVLPYTKCSGARSFFYVLLTMTRGEVLRYAIAFALRRARKIIRGLKDGLTEEERYAVANHVVAQLKDRGDPWRLNEEAPPAEPPST